MRISQQHLGETELRQAFEREEFLVYYQPIVDIETREIRAAEALVRWHHPQHGLLTPGAFFPLVEGLNLIVLLSEWVLHTICTQSRRWRDTGLVVPSLSYNPAVAQFRPGYLRDLVAGALAASGIPPSGLVLEVHESLLAEEATASATLTELAGMGMQLWLDDFGSGPSALRYLAFFPFTTLKLDSSFVHDIVEEPRLARIVSGLILLAHHLGLKVVAEAVWQEPQRALLSTFGCDMMQGWLFRRPLPADEFAALLASRSSADSPL
jgi:EAL domain-containing protein (putative c-di-GMP-specific phosphodiesterase class I)